MAARWPADTVRMVLDVGANVGQSAHEFEREFPQAAVHCFEPIPSTFAKLKVNVQGDRFHLHPLAMGSSAATLEVQVTNEERHSDMNSLRGPHPFLEHTSFRTERIQVGVLDTWCAEHGVTQIDYLKIDTEGYDLEVLKGAAQLLAAKRIRCLEAEVSMSPANTFHVPLAAVSELLAAHGYYVFGIYDQMQEQHPPQPFLRRANVLFTHDGAARA
jgi:FkbM family methyltransferase